MRDDIHIHHINSEADINAVRDLFTEYQQWLDVDLCFQGFVEELKTLPGAYTPPEGCLLVAIDGDRYAGVIGVRRLTITGETDLCEMKRLFVRPPWRGEGVGRALSEAAINWAREAGYGRMCLDTLEKLAEARQLYISQGFRDIEAYYDNPLESPLYMERDL